MIALCGRGNAFEWGTGFTGGSGTGNGNYILKIILFFTK